MTQLPHRGEWHLANNFFATDPPFALLNLDFQRQTGHARYLKHSEPIVGLTRIGPRKFSARYTMGANRGVIETEVHGDLTMTVTFSGTIQTSCKARPVEGTLVGGNVAAGHTWIGFGVQGGGHLAIAGKDSVEGCLYSLEDYRNRFWLNIDGYRVGPGLGGSIGVVFVVATGGAHPNMYSGVKVNGFDFQANMGGRWSDLAKGLKGLSFVSKFAKAGKIIDTAISIAEWEKLRDLIYNGVKAAQIDFQSAKPEVNVIGIPGVGTGLEISGYYGWGTVLVHDVSIAR